MTKLIETNQIFNKDKSKLRTLFTTFSFKSVKSIRDFMLFVNNILINYGLKITSQSKKILKSEKTTDDKTKKRVYCLEFCDNYNTINELIQYKINRGYKLNDTDEIRPEVETNEYEDLIKTVEEEEEEEEEEEDDYLEESKDLANVEQLNNIEKYPDPFGLDFGLD